MSDGAGTGTPNDLLGYDELVENALLAVVRTCLERTAKEGLPGEHHFYISFDTEHPEVQLSDELREKYHPEMTIVLQHQFEDLIIDDQGFSVGLSFGGSNHFLVIPWSAVTAFLDPSVNFGLQFRYGSASMAEDETATLAPVESDAPLTLDVKENNVEAIDGNQPSGESPEDDSNIIALDQFRKK
jgi:uncharacterized protein